MRLTECSLRSNGIIYRKDKDTGYRVRGRFEVVDVDDNDTGYRLCRSTFYDSDGHDTGFYIGGCLASQGCGGIYGPSEQMPWEGE